MKRILSVTMFFMLMFVLVACGEDENNINNSREDVSKNKFDISQFVSDLEEKYNSGKIDYDTAIEKLSPYEEEHGNIVSEAKQNLKKLNDSKNKYEEACKALEGGKYEAAISAFKFVIESDTNYADAQTKLKDSEQKYEKEVLAQVDESLKEKNYDEAFSVLDNAGQYLDYDLITNKRKEVSDQQNEYESGIIAVEEEKIQELIDAGEFIAAKDAYKELKNQFSKYDLNAKIKEVDDIIIETSIASAEKLLKEYKIEEAIGVAEQYKYNVADASRLEEEVERINSFAPTRLMDMDVFHSNSYKSNREEWKEQDKANTGENGFVGIKYRLGDGWLIIDGKTYFYEEDYLLNNSYKKFKCTLMLHQEDKNSLGKAWFEIYSDGKLIHKTDVITGGVLPIDIDVDVTNAGKLTIVAKLQGSDVVGAFSSKYAEDIGLINANLYKEVK